MPGDLNAAMEAEFDTVARWTADVAIDLGPDYYLPAACRGSGQPAALDWLRAALRPRPGDTMIDVGAGVGGPAAHAAGRTGVRPVLLDPEHGACRAAARLFGAAVVQADAACLPLATATVDVAWCLGVLCTAPGPAAQLAMLRELRRVLRPAGRLGLLVLVAAAPRLDDPPQGNSFPDPGRLRAQLSHAGLAVGGEIDGAALPPAPAAWADREAAVEAELDRRYGATPQLAQAREQSRRIGRLLADGQLATQLLWLRPAG
jgi:SAM-dependent methyltransferase